MAAGCSDRDQWFEHLILLLHGKLSDDAGNPVQVGMDHVVNSLQEAGLEPGQVREVLVNLASQLNEGAHVADLERALHAEVSRFLPNQARPINLYNVLLEYSDGTTGSMTHAAVADVVKKGFREGKLAGGRKLIVGAMTASDLAKALVKRFSAQPGHSFKDMDVVRAALGELELQWSRTIDEFTADLSALVATAQSQLDRTLDARDDERATVLQRSLETLEQATQAILLAYDYLPGLYRAQTFSWATGFVEAALEAGDNLLALDVTEHLNSKRLAGGKLEGDLASPEALLGQVKASYHVLQRLDCYGPQSLKLREVDQAIAALRVLLDVVTTARSLDPADRFTQEEMLRYIYRHCYCDLNSLTRCLCSVPGHVLRALRYLLRCNYVRLYEHERKVIVALTQKGEEHCRGTLGLRYRFN